MAVKKVIIPRSQLIPVDAASETLVRFRILSDDRNRFSEWSPIFSVYAGEAPTLQQGRVASFMIGSVVNIIWEGLPPGSQFDIFVGIDGETPTYHGTTSETRYVFINSAEENYKFTIQVSSIAKAYDELLQIFESELIDVV